LIFLAKYVPEPHAGARGTKLLDRRQKMPMICVARPPQTPGTRDACGRLEKRQGKQIAKAGRSIHP